MNNFSISWKLRRLEGLRFIGMKKWLWFCELQEHPKCPFNRPLENAATPIKHDKLVWNGRRGSIFIAMLWNCCSCFVSAYSQFCLICPHLSPKTHNLWYLTLYVTANTAGANEIIDTIPKFLPVNRGQDGSSALEWADGSLYFSITLLYRFFPICGLNACSQSWQPAIASDNVQTTWLRTSHYLTPSTMSLRKKIAINFGAYVKNRRNTLKC